MTLKWERNGVFFPRAAHATSAAQQNASPSSSQDHQETGIRRFRNCTVSGGAGSGTKQTATTPPCYPPPPGTRHVISTFFTPARRVRRWIPRPSARKQEVNSHMLPLRDFAFRWISLDQQLSDFHFNGESLPFFPHYVQRIVYMILFYFRYFVCGLIMTSFVLTYQRHYIRSG